MRILAIRGKNIASLEGDFEIDFTQEPLLSNGIYTISGPTGAGKSTILDVLCLALYNKTPRLSNASGNNIADVEDKTITDKSSKSLLRKGSVSCFAEVDFIAVTGESFRARLEISRAYGKITGNIKDPVIRLRNLSTGTDCPEVNTAALKRTEELLGLSYDQFSRAVLLAQGEFSAFLKAKDNERAALLEKLTGTDIYTRISKDVFERCGKAKSDLDQVMVLMQDYKLLTQDELAQLKLQKKETEEKFKRIDGDIESIDRTIEWFKQEEEMLLGIETIRNQIALLTSEKETLKPVEVLLAKIKELRPVEEQYRKFQTSEQELQTNLNALTESRIQLPQLENRCQLAENSRNESLRELDALKNDEPSFYEKCNAARKIDTQYGGVIKEIESLLPVLNRDEEIWKKANVHTLDTTKKLQDLRAELQSLTDWLNVNRFSEVVAEKLDVILLQLKSLSELRSEYGILNKQETDDRKVVEETKEKLAKSKLELQRIRIRFNQYQEEEREIRNKLGLLDIHDLNTQRESVENNTDILMNLERIWSNLNPKRINLNDNSKEIAANSELLVGLEKKLNETRDELRELDIKIKHTESLEQNIRLRVSENVKALRSVLRQGMECPVCGSSHHVYSGEDNSQFQVALDELLNELSTLKEHKNNTLQSISRYETEIKSLSHRNRALSEQNEMIEKEVASLESALSDNILSTSFLLIPDAEKKEYIDNQNEALRKRKEEVNRALTSHQKLSEQHRGLLEKIQQEKNASSQIEKEEGECGVMIDQTEQNISKTVSRKQGVLEDLQQKKQSLTAIIGEENWWGEWKLNPVHFTERIRQQAQTWKDRKKRTEELTQKQGELQVRLKADEEQESAALRKYQETATQTDSKKTLAEELKQNRLSYFNGRDVESEEKAHNIRKTSLEATVEAKRKEVETAKNSLTLLHGSISQLEKTISLQDQNCQAARSFVETWLTRYNDTRSVLLPWDEVTELFNLSQEYLDGRQAVLKEHTERMLSAQATFDTHQQNLEKHRAKRGDDEASREVVLRIRAEKGEERGRCNQDLADIRAQLLNHAKNEEKLGELLKKQEALKHVYDNWSKLNEVIGQKDGGKFRGFAQEFTLDVLLQNANIHIRDIAPRYKLMRIPGSLSLQVMDRDMCDVVRSVYSLSGGETFLVSLALALGLSSLSSRQMNIESLFIDEGFGSLDQETLAAAMDALESLRLQGRKVGVITHVREMTERISTRIRVRKKNNGASYIEIEG